MEDMGGGMGSGWRPGSRDITWDRTITAIDGDTITLDAPLTTSLDRHPRRRKCSGVHLARTDQQYRRREPALRIGVRRRIPKMKHTPGSRSDGRHARTRGCGRSIFAHFASSAVTILDTCSRDHRRRLQIARPRLRDRRLSPPHLFHRRPQTLFGVLRPSTAGTISRSDSARPGRSRLCSAKRNNALDDSGPIDSWASGILFDNVRIDGAPLSLMDRRNNNFFAGWSAANSVIWQCSCSLINCFNPPGATTGASAPGGCSPAMRTSRMSDNFVRPDSLFYGQLAERLSKDVSQQAAIMQYDDTGASSNPKPEDAAAAIALATKPAPTMFDWVDAAPRRNPIPTDSTACKCAFDDQSSAWKQPRSHGSSHRHHQRLDRQRRNARHRRAGHQVVAWRVRPDEVAESIKDGPNITRFAPGRIGPGLTDDLNQLTDDMLDTHRVATRLSLWPLVRPAQHRSRAESPDQRRRLAAVL